MGFYDPNRMEQVVENREVPQALHHRRKSSMKRRYGLTANAYRDKLEAQGYACAICKTPFKQVAHAPALDHDHLTGQARGFLCPSCNLLMAAVDDDERLAKLAEYRDSYRQRVPVVFTRASMRKASGT